MMEVKTSQYMFSYYSIKLENLVFFRRFSIRIDFTAIGKAISLQSSAISFILYNAYSVILKNYIDNPKANIKI